MKLLKQKLNVGALGMVTIAMVLTGTNAIALKYASSSMDPLVFASLRALAVGVILISFVSNYRLIFSRKILLRLIPGVLLLLLFFSLHALGVSQSGALKASVFSLTIPVFVYIFSIVLLHEPLIKRIFLGGIITLVGSMTMVGLPVIFGQAVVLSDLFLLFAYSCLAGAVIHGKYMFKWLATNELLSMRFLLAGVLMTGFVLAYNGPTIFTVGDGGAWLALLYGIIIVGVGANTLLYRGLSRLKAEQTAPLMYLDPMTGALMATLLLGESLETSALVGVAIIVIGVIAAFPHHHHLMHNYLHPHPHRIKRVLHKIMHPLR